MSGQSCPVCRTCERPCPYSGPYVYRRADPKDPPLWVSWPNHFKVGEGQ